jgi:hypothetical protein
MKSLAAFMRAVSKQIATPLLATVADDKLKMAKIEENYDQFIIDHPFDDGKKKTETRSAASVKQTTVSQPIVNDVLEASVVDSRS